MLNSGPDAMNGLNDPRGKGMILFQMSGDPASVRDGLRAAMRAAPLGLLTRDDRATAEIVLAEVLNNIAEHAYATVMRGPIRMWLRRSGDRLHCLIEDEGAPMPGGALPMGRPPAPDDLGEGGYGWHLIRSLTEGLRYERVADVNRLQFSLPGEQ